MLIASIKKLFNDDINNDTDTRRSFMVEIKFLARFRDITGERSVKIEYNGNFSDLLNILTQKYGNEFKDALLNKDGELRDYMKILVNGEDFQTFGGLDTQVEDEDEIVIFQTIAGG